MEKLIELLNEYTKQSYDDYSFFRYIEPTHSFYIFDDGYESYIPEEVILGKRFGVISWLVENDKIDFQIWKGEKYLEHPIGSDNFDGVHDYKDIIQRLSISDTPIEDLISYLK